MADNFSRARGRYRRIVSYDKAPRQEFILVDQGVSRSFDRNSLYVHRDFFYVPVPASNINVDVVYALYDEDYVVFTGQDQLSKTFNITFPSTPHVALEIEATPSGTENIVAYLMSATTGSITVGLSAEFIGNIRYRAVYSPTYPAFVRRSLLQPALFYSVSIGSYTMNGATSLTASFAPFGGSPTSIWATTVNSLDSNNTNVWIEQGTYSLNELPVELSDGFSGDITFMAVR